MRAASSADAPTAYNAGVNARLPALLRLAWRLPRLAFHIGVGLACVALLFPAMGVAGKDRVIGWWARRLLRILGVRLYAEPPPELTHGALLVCNHISWLDIYALLATRRVHFVSKAEVRHWPVLGWLAAQTGTLFIERSRRADTARINAEMAALIAQGRWVAVFPEGTTTRGDTLKRFLPALMQPALTLECPIVPAALAYRDARGQRSTLPAYVDDISLWQSVRAIAGATGLSVTLRFAGPLRPAGHRRELAAQAEGGVARLLGLTPASSSADTPRETPAGLPDASR